MSMFACDKRSNDLAALESRILRACSVPVVSVSESGKQKVSLDDAIRAMRLTAQGMRNEFKETSLSGLATSVALNIPVSVPDC